MKKTRKERKSIRTQPWAHTGRHLPNRCTSLANRGLGNRAEDKNYSLCQTVEKQSPHSGLALKVLRFQGLTVKVKSADRFSSALSYLRYIPFTNDSFVKCYVVSLASLQNVQSKKINNSNQACRAKITYKIWIVQGYTDYALLPSPDHSCSSGEVNIHTQNIHFKISLRALQKFGGTKAPVVSALMCSNPGHASADCGQVSSGVTHNWPERCQWMEGFFCLSNQQRPL